MRGHTKTALGIDIGAQRLSVALVEKGEQGFRVLAAASGDLPRSEPQPPSPACGRVLSRLLAQLGWRWGPQRLLSRWGPRSHVRRARAALALAPDSLVMQLLDMPRRMPANLGDFVRSELQQYVALSGKTVLSDFRGVGSGVQKRVLAVAADGDEIQEMTEACSTAASGIDTVEPAALAYARAFLAREKGLLVWCDPASVAHPPSDNRPALDPEGRARPLLRVGDALIAVLGRRTLTTTVFRRDTLDFVRVRQVPADANTPPLLCRWLADELKAVERYYEMQISPPGGNRRVCLAIHDSVYCADELAPLLEVEAGTGPQARSIALGGPTKAFGVTDVHEPWTAPGAAKEEMPLEGVSLVAVGTALALLEPEGDDLRINLLPPAVAEAKSLVRQVLLTAIAGVVLFLGVFGTAQLLTRMTGAMNRRIEETRLSEELYTASALIAEEKFLDQEVARLQRQVEPLRQILKGRQKTDWPGLLRVVRQATPEGVSVTQLQCENGRNASLRGLAPSCPAAEAFVRNLETQRAFASVSLMFVQRRQNKDDPFEYRIDCLLAAKGGESS